VWERRKSESDAKEVGGLLESVEYTGGMCGLGLTRGQHKTPMIDDEK